MCPSVFPVAVTLCELSGSCCLAMQLHRWHAWFPTHSFPLSLKTVDLACDTSNNKANKAIMLVLAFLVRCAPCYRPVGNTTILINGSGLIYFSSIINNLMEAPLRNSNAISFPASFGNIVSSVPIGVHLSFGLVRMEDKRHRARIVRSVSSCSSSRFSILLQLLFRPRYTRPTQTQHFVSMDMQTYCQK